MSGTQGQQGSINGCMLRDEDLCTEAVIAQHEDHFVPACVLEKKQLVAWFRQNGAAERLLQF